MADPKKKNQPPPNLEEKGLPVNIEAERMVLGAILLDSDQYIQAAATLKAEDFSLEKHRKIFTRMGVLSERGEKIDRVTVANELMKFNELEACDGVSYLVSLDDGMPQIPNLESYARIVKEKSALRQIIFNSQHMMNLALAQEETPDEILAGAREALLPLSGGEGTGLQTPEEIISSLPEGIGAFLDPSKRPQGLLTGFHKFDEYTNGLHSGDLFILAARPSMGKTALALNIAQYVAIRKQKPVAIFSLEMSKESLLTRMLCAEARVDSQRYRAGYLGAEERRRINVALSQIMEAPLYIDDTAGVRLVDIHSKLRKLQTKVKDLSLVIVDYLQLMAERSKYENRNQEVSAISRGMKLIAKEMGLPMLVLSQLSRAPELRKGNNRPQLSDLRESGSIEQDADIVTFIFREEVYRRDREDLRGLAELIIGKQRNGPIGTVNLIFLHAQAKFENRAEDVGEPELSL